MKRTTVVSSNIRSVGFDDTTKTLEVEFQSGGVYLYRNFHQDGYEAFLASESKGHFLNNYIKKRGILVERVLPNGKPAPAKQGPVLAVLIKMSVTYKPGLSFTHHLWCLCGRPNYKKGVETLYTKYLKAIGEASKGKSIGPEYIDLAIELAKEGGL